MKRRLRILSLCTRYLPTRAGADNMMHATHRMLIEMGHDVTVLAVNNEENSWPEEEIIDEVVIIRRPVDYGYEMAAEAVERRKPDLLFGQFGLLPYAVEHAVEADLPVVVWCHLRDGFEVPRRGALVEMIDLFVFNSTALYEAANTNVRHVVVNPPIEHERVWATSRDPRYVTMVNLSPIKGPEIFYHLAKRFPDQQFLGVEGGYDDQVKEALPNVEFLPHGCDMREVYGRTKVLLMPSRMESFGMAAVEAQANGVPVIAADLTALHDSLGDGALYANTKKKRAWETALRTLLVQSDYYERLAQRARTNVQRYDFKRDMRTLDAVLQDLIMRGSERRRPSIHRLGDEYGAAQDEVRRVWQARGQRPRDEDVAKAVESASRPDVFGAALAEARASVA